MEAGWLFDGTGSEGQTPGDSNYRDMLGGNDCLRLAVCGFLPERGLASLRVSLRARNFNCNLVLVAVGALQPGWAEFDKGQRP